MSPGSVLQARVEQYLAERRQLGFKLRQHGSPTGELRALCSRRRPCGPLTVELMAAGRARPAGAGTAPPWRGAELLRPFTAWLRQFDPATEVPDEAVFGRVPGRMTPHVYREPEIVELLAAARQLGPEGGLRPR